MKNAPIVWIDTETGGLEAGYHSLLTIAALAMVDGKVIDERSWYIRQNTYTVSPEAMKVNGLSLIDLYEQGKTVDVVADELNGFVRRFDTTFTDTATGKVKILKPRCGGHNVQFDRGFLKATFPHLNLFHHEDVDTKTIASFLADAGLIEEGGMSLSGLYERIMDKPLEGAHDALADIRATAELYLMLLNIAQGN